MGDSGVFAVIWATVGASGLAIGTIGLYLTRRRFRAITERLARAGSEDLSPAA